MTSNEESQIMLNSQYNNSDTIYIETNNSDFSNHTSIEANLGAKNLFYSNLSRQFIGSNHNATNSSTKFDTSYEDDWFSLKVNNLVDIFSICCSTAVIFGALVPYIPQYLKIKRSMSADGFSTYVCLTLLLANIMRIMFWCGHHFDLPLLVQSFVVITGMLAMMEICIRVRHIEFKDTSSIVNGSYQSRRHSLLNGTSGESQPIYSVLADSISASGSDTSSTNVSCSYQQQDGTVTLAPQAIASDSAVNFANVSNSSSGSFRNDSPSIDYISSSQQCQTGSLGESQSIRFSKYSCFGHFWDWDDNLSYINFLSLFSLILALITYLLIDYKPYIETLGFVALFTESLLGVPQLLKNHIKRSTLGMSVEMVIMWLSGDIFKTLYFIIRKDPIQFTICGLIQVMIDILILIQVLWFKKSGATYRKLPR